MVRGMQNMSDVQFLAWFSGAVEGGWEPLPGGQWDSDDDWANLLPGAPPMSQLVCDLAGAASTMHDAVLALAFASIDDQPSNVLVPQAVMARSTIECLATGLWLCLPDEQNERSKRYLSLSFQDLGDVLGFSGGPRSTLSKEGAQMLRELGVDAEAGVQTTKIITAIDATLGTDTIRAWRFYSGLAHGRPWARQVLQRSYPEPESDSMRLGQAISLLKPATTLARSLLTVADLRRRFPGLTNLESDRLQRIRDVT